MPALVEQLDFRQHTQLVNSSIGTTRMNNSFCTRHEIFEPDFQSSGMGFLLDTLPSRKNLASNKMMID